MCEKASLLALVGCRYVFDLGIEMSICYKQERSIRYADEAPHATALEPKRDSMKIAGVDASNTKMSVDRSSAKHSVSQAKNSGHPTG
jgi:hypothetical protein